MRHALSLTPAVALATALCAQIPSPRDVLGHDVGADHFLATYTQLRDYWNRLEVASDRLVVETFGTTSYGQDMVAAIVSSPKNLARLDDIRRTNKRLALGRDVDLAVARELVADHPAVVWIDAGMHSTESVAAQNILELTYRMTAGDSDEVSRILDDVVLVVIPANPDGLEMIASAYMASQRVGSIPVLYQRYIGHDNNRDYYAANQPETRALCRMIYHRWLPQILCNHHQSAPRGTVIFTPPFREPYNFHFDPIVVNGMNTVAAHINRRFASEGKPGVISRTGAPYSAWWNGGLRTMGPFHNIIGILTESFGHPNPTKLEPNFDRRVSSGDYPFPVQPQMWHARQTIEYLQTVNFAILDFASRYREEVVLDQWRMARNSIARGERDHWTATPKLAEIARERDAQAQLANATTGAEGGEVAQEDTAVAAVIDAFRDPELRDPRVYVIPSDQANFTGATRMIRSLRYAAIEVHRADETITVGAREYPRGSYFLFTNQANRPHLMDMFEPQWHPDLKDSNGNPVRPYDSAGWTLALQQDIEFDRLLDDPVDRSKLSEVELLDVPEFAREVEGEGSAGFLLEHADLNSFEVTNRLMSFGAEAYWIDDPEHPQRGDVFIRARPDVEKQLARAAKSSGIRVRRVERAPNAKALALKWARVGVFDVYGGNMATGWTEWVLRENGFRTDLVFAPRIDAGDLRADFDVLVFQTGLPAATQRDQRERALNRSRSKPLDRETVDTIVAALPPFEDWSTVGDRFQKLDPEKTIPALREFVEQGGVLLTFGRQATRAVSHFDLPVEEGVWLTREGVRRRARSSEFFIPGSLIWMDVDSSQPESFGCSPRLATMFRRSPVFAIEQDGETSHLTSLAHYIEGDSLASGWGKGTNDLAGKSAAIRAKVGDGAVYLFGSDVLYRGQPGGTFKLVFNAILAGTARSVDL